MIQRKARSEGTIRKRDRSRDGRAREIEGESLTGGRLSLSEPTESPGGMVVLPKVRGEDLR